MKISIITPVFNNETLIARAINSIHNQTYQNIEHIIVDGKSTDNTIGIIKNSKFFNRIILISEEDKGLYDAINKGIMHSSGSVISLLHSDDIFSSNKIVNLIMQKFLYDKELELIYGDVIFCNPFTKKIIRKYESKNFNPSFLNRGIIPAHTSCFIKKSVFLEFGYYDPNYRIAGDFEFISRIFCSRMINFNYIQKNLIKMAPGGLSSKNFISHIIINMEIVKALKKNKIQISYIRLFLRYFTKIKEFIFIQKILRLFIR